MFSIENTIIPIVRHAVLRSLFVLLSFCLLLGCVVGARATSAPGYKVIAGFPTLSNSNYISSSVISGSIVYCTTYGDGSVTTGTVFKMNLDGSGYTVLHDFGSQPSAPFELMVSGSTLVAASVFFSNGVYDFEVFKLNTDGSGFTDLHNFTPQGLTSPANFVVSGNVLYGTTYDNTGATGGTIFKVNLDGTGYATVYTFGVAPSEFGLTTALIVSGNTLFGAGEYGGASQNGVIFKVGTGGTGYAALHTFSVTDGAFPSRLILSGTMLYGATSAGGAYGSVSSQFDYTGGTLFKVNTDGTGFVLMHSFQSNHLKKIQGSDGLNTTAFALSGNTLYGCSQNGGVTNWGSVYSIETDGTNFQDLYNFNTYTSSGLQPITIAAEGTTLYGIVSFGGSNQQGAVFSLPTTGSLNSWGVDHLAVAPDGTERIEWIRDDEAVIIWTVDKNGNLTHQSPVYGPYLDTSGTWKPGELVVAKDGTMRLLWRRTDHAMGVWSLDTNGGLLHVGPVYGPYPTGYVYWDPDSIAVAPDGTTRVVWQGDELMGVWNLDVFGNQTHVGQIYGPYIVNNSADWYPAGIGVANDNTAQVAWARSDGAVGVWTLDALGNETRIGPTYGPYSDAGGAWSLYTSSAVGDGTSRLFWTRQDGAMGLWSFSAADIASAVGPIYGPYQDANGQWNAIDVSAAPDGTTRVLWSRGDRAAGVWSFNASDTASVIGSVYGPY